MKNMRAEDIINNKENTMKTPIMIKVAARGAGLGYGGERQRDFGASICVCPECGHKERHTINQPCSKTRCPECGTPMFGE
jgi:hypothetical protein